ncbi:MAG: MSHA biogenesis protein MshA [Idiomarina sp.]|nr:MAG: MSHA biogenesis protein MshA [Idiomarina sp.]
MKTQKGFTLIELIIVIVVLGILAVTAAPQFFNFSSDARLATLQGMQGSIKGASDLIYGKSVIAGTQQVDKESCGDAGDEACEVEGIETKFGYPVADLSTDGDAESLGTIFAAVQASDWSFASADLDTATTFSGTVPAGSIAIYPSGQATADWDASTPTGCFILYTESSAAGAAPTAVITSDKC